jgi:hypothetical protein
MTRMENPQSINLAFATPNHPSPLNKRSHPMEIIKWNDVPDDLIAMAKDVADGKLSMEVVAKDYKELITELVPHVKPVTEVYVHSVVSMRADYLRSLLVPF